MLSQSFMCHTIKIVVIFTLISSALAIRVDWNTNHGPIVPPTSTVAPVPQPPFRAPAAVWEDQSNDVPNPNKYEYVPPPPSRPRYNNPDNDNQQYHHQQPQQQNQNAVTTSSSSSSTSSTTTTTTTTTTTLKPPTYGTIISHPNQLQDASKSSVSSLATKYIPNYGNKYVAVVPGATYQKAHYLNGNDVYDKQNGKYNPKLKKYKAFEQKAKMVPYFAYYIPKQQNVYYNPVPAKKWDTITGHYNHV